MPSGPQRFVAVTSSMPDLYQSIFEHSVVLSHVRVSRENANKLEALHWASTAEPLWSWRRSVSG
jgi:hypothetical protein